MPADQPQRSRASLVGPLVVLGLLFLAIVGVGGFLYVQLSDDEEPPIEEPLSPTRFELPPLENPQYENTAAEATYVGIETCAECHADQFQSYQRTAHSDALSPVDPSEEPADDTFAHALSGRKYEIYRKGDEFRQREYTADEMGVIAQQDFAMDWLIGSGNHSRSYLVNADGFLVESPVTWYEQRDEWDVSPGYDHPHHWGFERSADSGCVFCHVGQAIPEGESPSRLTIREQAIGCERCHGPGSLHVAKHRGSGSNSTAGEAADPTIVHPGRLDRRLSEDICAQCHLRGDATVTVRNRDLTDFRPGMPLSHIRVDYLVKNENRPMKVVGHVEQMRLSECWQAEGSTLTCTTCHDPHQDAPPENKIAFYREKCMQCHTPDNCGLPVESAARTDANDNCVQCHMPQVDTDIPHIAFTHHRIGIHDADSESVEPVPLSESRLIPTANVSPFEEIDRDRMLGLAYLEYSAKLSSPPAIREFRNRAFELLMSVHERGLQDGDTDAGLAMIFWQQDSDDAIFAAHSALASDNLSPQSRINVLFVLADMAFRKGEHLESIDYLEQLVELRRHSEDHLMLANSHASLGRYSRAIDQAEKALKINPFRTEIYQFLVEIFEKSGRPDEGAEYAEKLRRLRMVQQPATVSSN